jgi:PAS domain S-box-containing protein
MKNWPGWLQALVEYFSSSISKKIITPYVLLTLILAAMGIFVVTQLVASSFEERLKNQLLEAGRVVSDEVVNRERTRLEVERVVANTTGVADALIDKKVTGPQGLDDLIAPIIVNAKVIDSIIIVDTQGKEVLRFQREAVGTNVSVKTEADSGLDLSGWPAVGQVLADPEGYKQVQLVQDLELNELMIYTVGPIRGPDEGVVGAALVGTYLEKELAELHNLALAQLTLFDQNGQVLATTFALNEAETAESFRLFTPERYRQVMESGEVTLLDQIQLPEQGQRVNTLTIGSRGYRLAYAPFILRQQAVGVYAVALPTNFITETTYLSQALLTAIFAIGIVIVFAIGYLLSQRIIQPILRLVRTSQAISAGDLDQRTGLERADEIGILATAFDDMTADLQRLLQIQEEEASKLNAILNSIADGVVVLDLNGQILVKNPAAEAILEVMGRELEQPSPQNIEDKEVGRPEGKEYTLLLNRLTGLEFREIHRFDELEGRFFSALSAPVRVSDKTQMGSVVVLRDITREVESEKLKDEFIESASHELKTPLTAIQGYTSLLKMMLEMNPTGQMGERQLATIQKMEKEISDLDDLIQKMLDLSQIDTGRLGIDQAPVNLSKLIQMESAEWIEEMERRGVSFDLVLQDDPIWVEGDRDKLAHVIYNLIKNAHDYTLPQGSVEVLVKQENGHGHVEVKDTGVGIREEDQRFLFTKFFRAVHEETHFGEVGGAGLGLYISRAIIEAHNGEMWMESVVNRGSIFSFALPIIDPDSGKLDER